jgi:hypothetical protein
MQNRPDKTALLEAVARFLATEVKPAIGDPNLAFRVLVAANLAAVVAAEVATEEAQEEAEANAELCRRILAGELDDAAVREATAHAMLTLRGELFAQSPKFDPSLEVEAP